MKNTPLVLETTDKTLVEKDIAPGILVTPAISEDFWLFRVKLNGAGQAILGFPKFFTVGIGFAKETDWNTNLPYGCTTEEIYNHIKHNKGDSKIPKARVLEAIRLVQSAAKAVKEPQQEKTHSHEK